MVVSGGRDVIPARRPRKRRLPNTTLAVLLGLLSTLGVGAGFVLTQIALQRMPPWLGAAFSVPSSTLLFWCVSPFFIDLTQADLGAAAIFAAVGLLFPATVTLLNFESNRLMGPNIAGAVSGSGPVFAVLLAVILLHENLRVFQLLGLVAIVGGVTLMYRRRQQTFPVASPWLLMLPLAAAAIRGAVQPIVKLGLERWPNPLAAVLIGYTISAIVLILAALVRNRGVPRNFDRRGAAWFAAVGICNGLGVLSTYAALGHGPVTLVSPLVASYPVVTVLLGHILLRDERIGTQLALAVAATVGGVVLLIVA
jgi:drug/metabolite transporter (DMT)-like permease